MCLRCLRRAVRAIDETNGSSQLRRAAFSTTAPQAAAKAAPPKKSSIAKPGTRQTKTLQLKKKSPRTPSARPPAPGERKAVRKRIVLSNTNALEVKGLEDLTGDKLLRHAAGSVTLDSFRGRVLGFNNETVDALRALEAFKPRQGWSLFRRPATLMRKETAQLANALADVESEKSVAKRLVFGNKGSGKSALLLQTQAMAYLRDWVVVHFPDGLELINAQTAYEPSKTANGTIYVQPEYTAKLLSSVANANQKLLSTMSLSRQHSLPIPVQSNMSLARFAELGARDPTIAWPIWQALWTELTTASSQQNRRPILISMDGVDQVMRASAYLDEEARPIHAHDLALVKHFVDFMSGHTLMPNGGMVMAATCASNRAASPTLDHCIELAHTQQHNAQLESDSQSTSKTLQLPKWDPFMVKDARVEAAMNGVQAVKLEGLSKAEARGMMEYYAQSGMLRGTVTDSTVSERWTMAGSGIIGELEKSTVRARF